MRRDVYLGRLKFFGEEHECVLRAACNYASTLDTLDCYGEAKSLLKKTIPFARRVLGASNEFTLRMRGCYAQSLWADDGATLDDVHEAVETYEDMVRISRRTLGSAHPLTAQIEFSLRNAQKFLTALTSSNS